MNRTTPTLLTAQRCRHHEGREAVARCPECGGFFCRECITEHEDRVICASCLKRGTATAGAPARKLPTVWPLVQFGAGLVGTWLIFYAIGRLLLALPSEFHETSLWDAGFFNAASQAQDDE